MKLDVDRLTQRAKKALSKAGLLDNPRKVYELVSSGEICYLSNVGAKTYMELCRYFGIRNDSKHPVRQFKPLNPVYLNQCINYLQGHGYRVIKPNRRRKKGTTP